MNVQLSELSYREHTCVTSFQIKKHDQHPANMPLLHCAVFQSLRLPSVLTSNAMGYF